jgi:hypothetical protein
MPNSPTTQAALHWLRSQQAPPHRSEEVARALAILEAPIDVAVMAMRQPLQADLELALLLEAEARSRFDLVAAMGTHAAAKPTIKHVKKVLFRARQRGIEVPEPKATRAAVSLAARPDPLPSFASSFDAHGVQLLVLGGWAAAAGPYSVLGLVSEREGLCSAWYMGDSSRSQQRDMLARLKATYSGLTVEVPTDFVAGRLRWALDLRDTLGGPVDGDLADVRRILADTEPVATVEVALDADDERRIAERARDSGALLDHPCFTSWLPADAALEHAITGLLAGEPADKGVDLDAVAKVRLQALDRWLDNSERDRIAARLEVSSWLLAIAGAHDTAVVAVSTARALRDPAVPLADIGLLTAALDHAAPLDLVHDWRAGRAKSPLQRTVPANRGFLDEVRP